MSKETPLKSITTPLKVKYGNGRNIKTFVFCKIHATGVKYPRVTEMAMVAIHRHDIIELGAGDNRNHETTLPRLMDKLVLCFDPEVSVESHSAAKTKLTTNDLKSCQKKQFDKESVYIINEFLKRQDKPICLVAHHGFHMEFPALKGEIDHLKMSLLAMENDNLWTVDTAMTFQSLDTAAHDEQQSFLDAIEYSFDSLYRRYLHKVLPIDTCTAEQYALSLMELVKSVPQEFINKIAMMKFSDIATRSHLPISEHNGANSACPIVRRALFLESNEPRPEYDIETFVFLDLETTGLDVSIENITELCMVAFDRAQVVSFDKENGVPITQALPRIMDKITFTIDPLSIIPDVVSRISGIWKQDIEIRNKRPFSIDTAMLLKNFLERQKQPICLVAHNGIQFDFKILKNHLTRTKAESPIWNECFCADTIIGLREFQLYQSNSLGNVFTDVGGLDAFKPSHTAESDIIALFIITKLCPRNLPIWLENHKQRFK